MTKSKNTDADVKFISALAEMLNEHDLTEIEVQREFGEDDSLTVRVARQGAAVTVAATPAAPVMAAPAAATPAGQVAAAETAATPDPAQDPNAVTSPMVGTVYLAPAPDAGNFVSPGDKVAEGDTVLIIEAMKTMNHIPAPRGGTVKRILVEDGSPVEFGAPLLILE